jgi:hypothetical protein
MTLANIKLNLLKQHRVISYLNLGDGPRTHVIIEMPAQRIPELEYEFLTYGSRQFFVLCPAEPPLSSKGVGGRYRGESCAKKTVTSEV